MSNMSYCRFHNTLLALQDCEEALSNEEALSESERKAAIKLIKLCTDIAENFGDYEPKLEGEETYDFEEDDDQ